MAVKKKTTKSKKKLDVKVKMIGELIDATGSSKDSWNPAEISDDMKAISYIRKLADTWNPAQLNEALKYLGFKTVDTWNPAELEETKNKLVKYFLPTNASGNPIELDLKGALPYEVSKLSIDLLPIQDLSQGEPSPTNICPITGRDSVEVKRTGKNLAKDENHLWSISGQGVVASNSGYKCFTVKIKQGDKLTYSQKESSTLVIGYFTEVPQVGSVTYNNSRTVIDAAFTTTTTAPIDGYALIRTGVENTECQIEYGSTATTYEPYQEEAATINLPSTTYGGTLDLSTGKLTIERGFKTFDGTENWSISGDGSSYITISDMKPLNEIDKNGSCSKLKTDSSVSGCAQFGSAQVSNQFFIINARDFYGLDTVEKIHAFTNGMQICYPLATPIEVTITAEQISLLKGNNTLTTDGDTINITYKAILNS